MSKRFKEDNHDLPTKELDDLVESYSRIKCKYEESLSELRGMENLLSEGMLVEEFRTYDKSPQSFKIMAEEVSKFCDNSDYTNPDISVNTSNSCVTTTHVYAKPVSIDHVYSSKSYQDKAWEVSGLARTLEQRKVELQSYLREDYYADIERKKNGTYKPYE